MRMKPIGDIRMSEFLMLHKIVSVVYHGCNNSTIRSTSSINFGDDGVTVSELSSLMNQTPSSVSQIIKSLEKKQLIVRTASQTDRRIVYVNLSEHGREALCDAEKLLLSKLDEIAHVFGEENSNQLITLLEKLADVIDIVPNSAGSRLPPNPLSQSKGMNQFQ